MATTQQCKDDNEKVRRIKGENKRKREKSERAREEEEFGYLI